MNTFVFVLLVSFLLLFRDAGGGGGGGGYKLQIPHYMPLHDLTQTLNQSHQICLAQIHITVLSKII